MTFVNNHPRPKFHDMGLSVIVFLIYRNSAQRSAPPLTQSSNS